MIPYGHQFLGEEEIEAVVNVLRSDWLTQGPKVPEFEQAVADFCQVPYGIAVANGTAALHLACLALGLSQGGRLWTAPNTFVASANCGLYCGAKIDFVDIDTQTRNISIEALEHKLTIARDTNQLPDILVAVHFAGLSCNMKAIHELSQEFGFKVIEDASHAIGGEFEGHKIGSCQYSDATVFSFHPVKTLTTAEGGLVTCKDKLVYQQLMQLRTHGVTKEESNFKNTKEGDWYYEQQTLGFNYRMTDLQAALGLVQLTRLPSFVEKRSSLFSRYNDLLKELPVKTPLNSIHKTAWHLYVIEIDDVAQRKSVFDKLRENDIGVNVHYIPVHLQPYYQQLGFKRGDFPVSEYYYAGAISLPLYPGLKAEEQERVVKVLEEALV